MPCALTQSNPCDMSESGHRSLLLSSQGPKLLAGAERTHELESCIHTAARRQRKHLVRQTISCRGRAQSLRSGGACRILGQAPRSEGHRIFRNCIPLHPAGALGAGQHRSRGSRRLSRARSKCDAQANWGGIAVPLAVLHPIQAWKILRRFPWDTRRGWTQRKRPASIASRSFPSIELRLAPAQW